MDQVRAHLVRHLGEVQASASVTFVGCEPIEVLRFQTDSGATYASLGMSRYPMTDPTDPAPDLHRGPRAEVLVTLTPPDDRILHPLAVVAAAPVVEGLVVVEGATIDTGAPLWPGAEVTGFVVGEPTIEDLVLGGLAMTSFDSGPALAPVRFLPLTPITADQLEMARSMRASP